MKYYLKKLRHQELGSIRADGKAQRGRYIYISKDKSVLEMFPALSVHITNDSALLPVIPIYIGKKIYCNFVYHNDKHTLDNGTRDEYRFYLNAKLEDNRLLLKVGDIVIFAKDEMVSEEGSQSIYFMDVVSDHNSALYKLCDKQLSASALRGEHCVYEGPLSEFDKKVAQIKKQDSVDVLIDTSVTKRIEETDTQQIAQLFNQSSFRDFVLVGYKNICAITKTVIAWNAYNNLEAAHIKPRSHYGPLTPDNGIAMCRDIHWAFDKGFFTINDEFKVVVHEDIQSDFLNSFKNEGILLPSNQFFLPNKDYLRYHRENVFGLFKTTGRL